MTIYTSKSSESSGSSTAVKAAPGRNQSPRPSRRGAFKNVLEDQQASRTTSPKKEINTPGMEQISRAGSLRSSRAVYTGFAVNPAYLNEKTSFDAAAATALLRLNALSPSRAGVLAALSAGGAGEERALAPASRMQAMRTAPSSHSASRSVRIPAELGSLAARFESGDAGAAAIGYDRQGGTSYGQYQISSRAGTMSEFLEFLQERAPDLARKLKASGPANTGGTDGGMPREWRRIAAEHADRFADLQRDFIEQTHYRPALEEIRERTGVDIGRQPRALQEVLWSTAVQHGPGGAVRLFCRAIENGGKSENLSTRQVIDDLYAARNNQFGSSTSDVQASVRRRFHEERRLALAMLAGNRSRGGMNV